MLASQQPRAARSCKAGRSSPSRRSKLTPLCSRWGDAGSRQPGVRRCPREDHRALRSSASSGSSPASRCRPRTARRSRAVRGCLPWTRVRLPWVDLDDLAWFAGGDAVPRAGRCAHPAGLPVSEAQAAHQGGRNDGCGARCAGRRRLVAGAAPQVAHRNEESTRRRRRRATRRGDRGVERALRGVAESPAGTQCRVARVIRGYRRGRCGPADRDDASGMPLKVLRVCSVFEPPDSALTGRGVLFDPVGGMQSHTGQLTRALDHRGVRHAVVTHRPPAHRAAIGSPSMRSFIASECLSQGHASYTAFREAAPRCGWQATLISYTATRVRISPSCRSPSLRHGGRDVRSW